MTKTLLNRAVTSTMDEFLELEPALQAVATSTPDYAEAVARFRNRPKATDTATMKG